MCVSSVETSKTEVPAEAIDVNEYPERCRIVVDNTQKAMEVTVAYRHVSSEAQAEAARNGEFPKGMLMGPASAPIVLSENMGRTNGADNKEAYTYLHASVDGPAAGEWYLLYDNFSNSQLGKTNRAALASILTPDETIYSRKKTPDHVVLDEYSKCTFCLPDLQAGNGCKRRTINLYAMNA